MTGGFADLAGLIPPPASAPKGPVGGQGPMPAGLAGNRGDGSRSAAALGAARRWYRSAAAPTFEGMCDALRAHAASKAGAGVGAWLREKGEAADGRELRRLWDKITAPDAGADDDAEIARLAGLAALAFEREREAAAERLGVRVSLLDKLVQAARGNGKPNGQGEPFAPADIEPWPQPVDGAGLLDGLAGAIRRHVVLSGGEADAVALWIVAAHAYTAFAIFPRLVITAAELQSGKTTLLDVIGLAVARPLAASSITAAALFRVIAAAKPTLLLDEADTWAAESEELRGVIDAGHRVNGAVIRTVGEAFEPRSFNVFAPLALAGIGRLAATILDRSIIIRLRRRRPDEPIAPLRLDRPPGEFGVLARQAARWTRDCGRALAAADPAMPGGLVNRPADNWRPLLAVADAAAGEWPARARRAALALIAAAAADANSVRVQLLEDIRDAFLELRTDRVASEALVDHLIAREDRPWPEWGRARKPITKVQIAKLLKPLGIAPQVIRLANGNTPRGYFERQFADAFARYLSSGPGGI